MTTLEGSTARELARSLTDLLDAARRGLQPSENELPARVTEHVGCALTEMPNVAAHYGGWELANLQRGLDAYLGAHSPGSTWFGIAGSGREHQDIVDMLSNAAMGYGYSLGAVDYTTVATGPYTSTDVVCLGLVRSIAPDGAPIVLALRGPAHHGQDCSLRVLAADRHSGTAAIAEVGRLMHEHNLFAGQLLSFDQHEYGGNELVSFLPRPVLAADDVVLPDGVLGAIERHVLRTPEQARRLTEQGQHLKRGLLLYGPPGTC
jgi:hypothetical protein